MNKEQFISSVKFKSPSNHEKITFNKEVDHYLTRIPPKRLDVYTNIINNSLLPLFEDKSEIFKKCFTLGRILEREKVAISENYIFRYFTMEEIIQCGCCLSDIYYTEIPKSEYGDFYDLMIPFFNLTHVSEETKIAKQIVREIINNVVPLKIAIPVNSEICEALSSSE